MKTYGFKLALSVAFIFLSIVVSAQGVVPSAKVSAAYTSEQLAKMSNDEIKHLNFLADNLCLVSENADKAANFPEFTYLDKNGNSLSPDVTDFNPLMFSDLKATAQNQYFVIRGTNKVIFVYSAERLGILYQRFLANEKK